MDQIPVRWQLMAFGAVAMTLTVLIGAAVAELRKANDQLENIYLRLYTVVEETQKNSREVWYLRQDVNEQAAQLRRKFP